MKKRLILIFAILWMAAVLGSCGREEADAFFGDNECAGGMELSDVNIKDIDFQLSKEGGTIGISFVKGSRISGDGENALEGVPKYNVAVLKKPRRLMITLEGVAYWDYYEKMNAALGDLVIGYFDVVRAGSNSYTLFLQLAANVSIQVEEQEANIHINLRTIEEDDRDDDYFVILNGFDQYKEGFIDEKLGLTPCYSSELNKVVMISEPIEIIEEAEKLKAEVDESISSTTLGKAAYIEELFSGQLPVYDANADQYDLDTRAVVKIDGKAESLPWVMENAVYLTTGPGGKRLFCRTMQPSESVDAEPVQKDVLFVLEETGKLAPVDLEHSFYGIIKAEYSADGKYLAVLDSTEYGKALYVIDIGQMLVKNMGEEGLGVNIADFAWSENGNVIYAMSGNEVMQLNQCDFSGDHVNMSAVEEQKGADSKIGLAGGKIYFINEDTIYQVDVSTGTRSEFTYGNDFAISPDKKYMAVKSYTNGEQDIATSNVALVDLATGQSVEVITDRTIECTEFTGQGATLYVSYTNDDVEGYGYTIEAIDVNTTERLFALESLTPQIVGDKLSDALYMIDNIQVEDGSIPITYEYAR